MKKVLITGFMPFAGETINPAYEAVQQLPQIIDQEIEIIKLEVPTVFHKSIEVVIAEIEAQKPDVVIAIGQAGGRFGITPERVAINIDDASIPDNENNQPLNQPIFTDGENAYFSTLPVKKIVQTLINAEIPATLSNSAGTFVCNHLMYGILYHIKNNENCKNIKAGFIHVPYMPAQVVNKPATASMNIHDITRALEIAIRVSIECDTDATQAILGETH